MTRDSARAPDVHRDKFRVRLADGTLTVMNASSSNNQGNWVEACGIRHIFRTVGLSLHPAKLGIALGAIIATIVFGGVLDWAWTRGSGIGADAISDYVASREMQRTYVEPTGALGPFAVWREHERQCIVGFLGSAIPGASLAAGTPLGSYIAPPFHVGPLRYLADMAYGGLWMMRVHPFFFLLFGAASLLIWSLGGGAICRIAAVQFARDERLTARQALAYAKDRLIGGFVLAPCIPLVFILIAAVLLVLGGMLLRVPILGDVLMGPLFALAILGGFVVAVLIVGLLIGGGLFWPTVAAEGSDAFDSFSRSLSYPLSRPWKALLYAIIATLLSAISWVCVNLFVYFALTITRAMVGFGTSPLGWWNRGTAEAPVRKLDLLWPLGGPSALYTWPDWSKLSWYEYFSASWIALYVMLVIGLMWAFLATFYFCSSTVLYFLLRRDVDATDLEEVFITDDMPVESKVSAAETPKG